MDTTTLVLLWDDVFENLLIQIKELLAGNQSDLFPILFQQVFLLPIRNMLITTINYLSKQLINPYISIFWDEIIESMLLYIYIGLTCYFLCQILVHIFKKIYEVFISKGNIAFLELHAVKNLFLLQCLHYIVYPIFKTILAQLPEFMESIIKIFQANITESKLFNLQAVYFSDDQIFLETILLGIVFVLILQLLFQFIKRGTILIFSFIKSYFLLLSHQEIIDIFLPFKNILIQMFVVFTLQRLLLPYAFTLNEDNVIYSLIQSIGILMVIVHLPKVFELVETKIGEEVDNA